MKRTITIDYVRAFTDAEGHVGNKKFGKIEITNTDYKLLCDISAFLESLGITCKIVYVKKYLSNHKDVWRITIYGFWNLAKYTVFIGFYIDYKHNDMLNYLKRQTQKGRIHNLQDYLYYRKNLKKSKRQLSRDLQIDLSTLQNREKHGLWEMSEEEQKILAFIESMTFVS